MKAVLPKNQKVTASSCLFVIALLLLFFPLTALAGGGGDPNHVPSIADTGKYWLNFIAFFGLLGFALRKPFIAFWKQRAADIESAVNAGVEAEKAAQERLASARERHGAIDDEVKQLRERIELEAKAEAKRVIEDAEERAKAISVRATEGLSAEQGNLEVRLRDELAQRVVVRAEEIVKTKITPEADRKLRDGVVGGIGGLVQ